MHPLFLAASILLAIWAIGVLAAWAVLTRVEDDPHDWLTPSNKALALAWPVVLLGAIWDWLFPDPAIVERLTSDTWAVDQDVCDLERAVKLTGWDEEQLHALKEGTSARVDTPPRTRVPASYETIECPKCGKRDFTLYATKCRAICHACGNEWVA